MESPPKPKKKTSLPPGDLHQLMRAQFLMKALADSEAKLEALHDKKSPEASRLREEIRTRASAVLQELATVAAENGVDFSEVMETELGPRPGRLKILQ